MFLRSTNNSLAASLDATSLPSHSEELPPSTSANAKDLRPSCSDAYSSSHQASGQADAPSPTFLALVVAAVEQAIAAEHTAMSTPASSSVAGGVLLHSRPACSPKLRPWQLLAWAFHQCRLLSPERLTKCKPHSLLSRRSRHYWELHFHPNRQQVDFVLDGIRHGFKLGFSHTQWLKSAKKNKSSADQHASVIDEYLANEMSRGRVAGLV